MDSKPKRRWFQVSLRTLFVLVTLAAIELAIVRHAPDVGALSIAVLGLALLGASVVVAMICIPAAIAYGLLTLAEHLHLRTRTRD